MSPRTVGVAPGSFTLQLGAPSPIAPNAWQLIPRASQCPADEISSGAYGVPTWNWYGYTLPGVIDAGNITQGPTVNQTAAPLYNPYGTESELKGLFASKRKLAKLQGLGFRGLRDQKVSITPSQLPIVQPMQNSTTAPAPTPSGWFPLPTDSSGLPSGMTPPAIAPVDTTPWYMQPIVLIPAILIIGWFGWKKLQTQHTAAPATPAA